LAALAAFATSGRHQGGTIFLAEATYFHVHEGETKCFLETTPEQQVLTVKYRHIDNPGVVCMLLFKDPAGKHVFSRQIGAEDKEVGRTAYMTQKRGEHSICIECTGKKWFQTTALKWELSVDMGDTDSIKTPLTKGEFSALERIAQSSFARAEAISAENEYEKSAENEFQQTSEAVNSHIVVVSLFFVTVEVALCAWQIFHLKGFFKSEKLI